MGFQKIKIIALTALVLFFGSFVAGSAQGGRLIQVKIVDQKFAPDKFTAYPGDTLKICNEDNYRRQPYSSNKYNRFSSRKANTFEMIKEGECREVQIQNPTGKWLKLVIRDAVAEKAKLVVNISPAVVR